MKAEGTSFTQCRSRLPSVGQAPPKLKHVLTYFAKHELYMNLDCLGTSNRPQWSSQFYNKNHFISYHSKLVNNDFIRQWEFQGDYEKSFKQCTCVILVFCLRGSKEVLMITNKHKKGESHWYVVFCLVQLCLATKNQCRPGQTE